MTTVENIFKMNSEPICIYVFGNGKRCTRTAIKNIPTKTIPEYCSTCFGNLKKKEKETEANNIAVALHPELYNGRFKDIDEALKLDNRVNKVVKRKAEQAKDLHKRIKTTHNESQVAEQLAKEAKEIGLEKVVKSYSEERDARFAVFKKDEKKDDNMDGLQ